MALKVITPGSICANCKHCSRSVWIGTENDRVKYWCNHPSEVVAVVNSVTGHQSLYHRTECNIKNFEGDCGEFEAGEMKEYVHDFRFRTFVKETLADSLAWVKRVIFRQADPSTAKEGK